MYQTVITFELRAKKRPRLGIFAAMALIMLNFSANILQSILGEQTLLNCCL